MRVNVARVALPALLLLIIATSTNAQTACNEALNWASQDCACSRTAVRCDALRVGTSRLSRIPFGVPPATTVLSLFGNVISSIRSTAFDDIPQLQVFNIRDNQVDVIRLGIFDNAANLRELYLEQNVIRTLPTGIFRRNTALRILNLGSNLLESFPATGVFDSLVNLEQLYLDNNVITGLPATIFNNNTRLTVLHLQNNRITQLDAAFFSRLVNLTSLQLHSNKLFIIPRNFFGNNTRLTSLGMLGNPSWCSVSSGNITCNCAAGYTSPDRTFCEARDCGSVIRDLTPFGTANCTGNTRFKGTNCIATCRPGYLGAQASYTCNANGVWEGNLQCTPVDCGGRITNLDSNAVATCVGNTRFTGDNCTARCNPGYDGGSAVFSCGSDGLWKGQLTCTRKDCGPTVTPLPTNALAPTCSRTLFQDTCNVTCKDGYLGGPAPFTCNTEGMWIGTLVCQGKECGRNIPNLPENSVARCRGDTSFGGNNCVAVCREGYEGRNATYRCTQTSNSTTGTWQTTDRLVCTPRKCPNVVDLPVWANRSSSCPNMVFNQTCNLQCLPGFVGPNTTFLCGPDGSWIGNTSIGCEPRDCGASLIGLDRFAIASVCKGNTRYGGDPCRAECARGYVPLAGTEMINCGKDGRWETDKFACVGVDCGLPMNLPPGVLADCSNTRYQGSGCVMSCADKQIGTGSNLTCNRDGMWDGFYSCPPAASTALSTGQAAGITVGILVIIGLAILALILVTRHRDMKRRKAKQALYQAAAIKAGASGIYGQYAQRRTSASATAKSNYTQAPSGHMYSAGNRSAPPSAQKQYYASNNNSSNYASPPPRPPVMNTNPLANPARVGNSSTMGAAPPPRPAPKTNTWTATQPPAFGGNNGARNANTANKAMFGGFEIPIE